MKRSSIVSKERQKEKEPMGSFWFFHFIFPRSCLFCFFFLSFSFFRPLVPLVKCVTSSCVYFSDGRRRTLSVYACSHQGDCDSGQSGTVHHKAGWSLERYSSELSTEQGEWRKRIMDEGLPCGWPAACWLLCKCSPEESQVEKNWFWTSGSPWRKCPSVLDTERRRNDSYFWNCLALCLSEGVGKRDQEDEENQKSKTWLLNHFFNSSSSSNSHSNVGCRVRQHQVGPCAVLYIECCVTVRAGPEGGTLSNGAFNPRHVAAHHGAVGHWGGQDRTQGVPGGAWRPRQVSLLFNCSQKKNCWFGRFFFLSF